MSVIRRRIAVLLSVPAFALSAVGCADVREQTQDWREPPHGTSAAAGAVDIRNALVVTDSEGNGTVYASFANTGDDADALTGVVVGGSEATPQGGELALPAGGVTTVAPDEARIDVSGLNVQPGRLVDVEFRFAEAPRVTVQVIAQSNEGFYANVTF